MSPYIGVPLLLALAALQSALAHLLAPLSILRPDFVVLVVIAIGLLEGRRSGVLWGAAGGFALDLASAGPLGVDILALSAVGFLGGLGQAATQRVNRLIPIAAAFAGTVVFGLLHMLLLQISGWDLPWVIAIYEIVLPSAVINAVFMPIVYGLLQWLRRRARPRPEIGW